MVSVMVEQRVQLERRKKRGILTKSRSGEQLLGKRFLGRNS